MRAIPTTVAIEADCAAALDALLAALDRQAPAIRQRIGWRAARAGRAKRRPRRTVARRCRRSSTAVETIRDTLPGSIIVGDSTQPIYAANLYYDHDRPGGWFNAATGFGALGYGPPAAIGAALAVPDATVVCLSGDGGFQFSLPELAAAVEAGAPVIFVVWNNLGYREIETSMREVGVEPVGVSPAPPDFAKIAEAYGIAAERLASPAGLSAALLRARTLRRALSHRDRGGLSRWERSSQARRLW